LTQSIVACREGGHIALIGVLAGIAGAIPTAQIVVKQLHIVGVVVGSRVQQLDMIRAIEANCIRPVIDRRFALEALPEAFLHQASGRHFGKICLSF